MSRAILWLADRGYFPGMHAHAVFGRVMIHAHEGYGGGESRLGWTPGWCGKLGLFHIVRPVVVGIVHGLAGSAAVTLLVLATITQPGWAITYLLVFGAGTILGMMLITAALAFPFAYTLKRFTRLNRGLAIASGVLSLSFGLFLCYHIGISDGLFTGHPTWTPR